MPGFVGTEELRKILEQLEENKAGSKGSDGEEEMSANQKAFIAMMMGNIEIFEELLPDIDLKELNGNGYTLEQLAIKLNRKDVAKLLHEASETRSSKGKRPKK